MKKRRIFKIFSKNKAITGIVLGIIGFTLVYGGTGIYRSIQKNKVLSESMDKTKVPVSDNTISKKEQESKKDESKEKNKISNKSETKKKNVNFTKKEVSKNSNNVVKKESNKGNDINITKKTSNNNSKKSNNSKKEKTGIAGEIARTNIAKQTNQIILVSGNNISLWNKLNGKWNKSLSTNARLGYGGLTSNKHEGDGATPTGAYPILYGFGFGSNPGTSLEYKKITNNSYFVDDVHSNHYNQWFEGKGQKGEHMIDHPQYKYGMVIGYNTSHTKGKGSAIFLHCNGAGSTAGCVSVPQSTMLRLLKSTHDGAYIIIISSNNNLKYF